MRQQCTIYLGRDGKTYLLFDMNRVVCVEHATLIALSVGYRLVGTAIQCSHNTVMVEAKKI